MFCKNSLNKKGAASYRNGPNTVNMKRVSTVLLTQDDPNYYSLFPRSYGKTLLDSKS